MTKEELEKEAEEKGREWEHSILPESEEDYVPYAPHYPYSKGYLAGAEPREKQIQIDAEQIRALQKQNGELTDKVKELEAQIEKMKCYLPVNERDSNHKWFAYKNLFDTEWKIDYSVQGELPKCNTIKWFENKEAVMFYLVSNRMKYYEEPRR